MTRWGVGAAMATGLLVVTIGCGGQEGSAAEVEKPVAVVDNPANDPAVTLDAGKQLRQISPAIPLYAGAEYRDDLTRRDTIMARNQFGADTTVYTLATNDSFPQVWHYYVTYLAQFRSFAPVKPYPPENQDWRTIEVKLNQAMQDPFIPEKTLAPNDQQVILQITETEADPPTVIRYILTSKQVNSPVAIQ